MTDCDKDKFSIKKIMLVAGQIARAERKYEVHKS